MPTRRRTFLLSALGSAALASSPGSAHAAITQRYHVIVYGGTPAGVMAACAAARDGMKTALVLGTSPLGGMVTGGLGRSDIKSWKIIGGLPRRFFGRLGAHYGLALAATHEPHVAAEVFQQMLAEHGVVVMASSLGAANAMLQRGPTIAAIRLRDGQRLAAPVFVDASYEGDLLALAGVRFLVGREARERYDESLAGFGVAPLDIGGPAYGDDGSLLPGVVPHPGRAPGSADAAVQVYNFRLCLSNDPSNSVPFAKPAGYDADRFRIYLNQFAGPDLPDFIPPANALPNRKFDLNLDAAYGLSSHYANGDPARRAAIHALHKSLQQGLLYFYANDPRVPSAFRQQARQYGLAADEFVDSGHWPAQLYIRSARRMIGETVLTQRDVQRGDGRQEIIQPTSIGKGGYHIDCHFTALYADAATNRVIGEGGLVGSPTNRLDVANIYQIPYEILLPRASEADNLLVPVCVSSSHVANCSIRMEPQYMIMGEAAGVAAALAVRERTTPGALAVPELQARLKAYGAIID